MKRGRDKAIQAEVSEAVARWPEFAAQAQLSGDLIRAIQQTHRTSFPAS